MFYLLDFKDHSFVSCNTEHDVADELDKRIRVYGVGAEEIEIVNGFLDGARLTVGEFYEGAY